MARNRYFEDESFEETKKSKTALRRTLAFALPYKKYFFIGLIYALLAMGASLIRPIMDKELIDRVIPSGDPKQVVVFAAVLLLMMMAEVGFLTLRNYILIKTGHRIIYDIRKKIFDHLQELSFDYYDTRPGGKIFVRVTSYVNALSGLLSTGLLTMVMDMLQLIVIVVMMLLLSPRLTLISFLVCIPLILFVRAFQGTMRYKWRSMNNKISNCNAYMSESIMGIGTIQSFDRQELNKDIFNELQTKVQDRWVNLIRYNSLFFPVIDMTGTVGTMLMYVLGFLLVTGGSIELGTVVAFSGYLSRFWAPINNISNMYNTIVQTMSNAERIFETIDAVPTIRDKEGAVPLPEKLRGEVRFDHVNFSYEKEDREILHDVSFTARPGGSYALVGPTGAGKTTVVNLISRFYDVDSGSVTIDGFDVRDVTLFSLRERVGVMMQDNYIFSGTVMDNIRYGRLDATDEECVAAAKVVCAHDFIMRLPKGYQTALNEGGTSLSAGERQLLSFARMILADPEIIILDEATSNIDTHTELLIQSAIEKLLAGRTSFVIAHRLSTIKRSDCIMYVSDGGIAERGTHDELLALKGRYYELYQSQFRKNT